MKKIALFSGGYDPLHVGHLSGFRDARYWADEVIVGLNSDDWLRRKKGYVVSPWEHRKEILEAIYYVDGVFGFDDSEGHAWDFILKVINIYGPETDQIFFCNGGDKNKYCPELAKYQEAVGKGIPECVTFLDGIGGDKIESSSEMINRAIKEMNNSEIYGNN